MNVSEVPSAPDLRRQLAEAEATIEALLSGQIDAVVDTKSQTPVLLAKAQEALRESEERYRHIIESTNEGVWQIDADSKTTFMNRRMAEMLGCEADMGVGRSPLEFLDEAGREHLALHTQGGGASQVEVRYHRADGTSVWALLEATPLFDKAGKYCGSFAMAMDITKRKEVEAASVRTAEALRESEERYRQIVEATTDGIIKVDAAALIVFVNQRFAEMLGYEPHELVGASVFDFMSPVAKEAAMAALLSRRRGVKDALDTTFQHRNESEIFVNIAGSALVDAEGHYCGNLAVVRDVTERKKLQAQLMVSDRMASVGTLAAGVAHEINNPLAAVIANLDCIAENLGRLLGVDSTRARPEANDAWLRTELKEPLDDARDAAQRMRFIVRELKTFSRSPADEPRGAVDVKVIMESSLRMAWHEIRQRARLVKHYGPVPPVAANEARLGQVFLNLIVNAAQALPDGQADNNEIRVSTYLDGERVIVEVTDTGPGIPPETIGRIFDAFFTTKEVGVGTGLGLAICQRIVADMEGELTVESEVGRGTTFFVSLPVAGKDETLRPPPPSAELPAGRRGRILVVDDEKLVARGLERTLSKEHDVVALLAAKDALALCASGQKFDLILCDLMMPDMTGMDLHRELSLIAPDQASRMIFLTGGAFTAKARQFLSETPKEHLEKPFDPANLRAIVQRYLRQSA